MLYGLFHLALMLVEVAHFAVSPTHIVIVFNSLGIVEKRLVYLAKVLADITFHFKGFYFTIILGYQCITELVAPLGVAQFVLNLSQYKQQGDILPKIQCYCKALIKASIALILKILLVTIDELIQLQINEVINFIVICDNCHLLVELEQYLSLVEPMCPDDVEHSIDVGLEKLYRLSHKLFLGF